ncbi:MAG TPA: hypothetical protein GX702_03725 [Chloroflexi bacterium]|nr:hypothetical protein [Chloroflexota bacterium]
MSFRPFLDDPAPDFAAVERIIRGQEPPRRVHLVELLMDAEIMRVLSEDYGGRRWIPLKEGNEALYYPQLVDLYHHLGYDSVNVMPPWIGHPDPPERYGDDTAPLSRGRRRWIEERHGLIAHRADLERFPWTTIRADYRPIEFAARALPPGMKLTLMGTVFQHVVFTLLGTERFLYMVYDDADLVGEVFERWGQIVYDMYAALVDMDEIGAIWHADDVGFNTSTLVSPDLLRRHLLPWLRRYADLAHAHGKTFWLHCCGNVYDTGLIEDLIDDVGVDAFHSFEDAILPVAEFRSRYGHRIAALGGVDMGALARWDRAELCVYMRDILHRCMVGGRYLFGSGNTIANYVPVANYLAMLEEARRWRA